MKKQKKVERKKGLMVHHETTKENLIYDCSNLNNMEKRIRK